MKRRLVDLVEGGVVPDPLVRAGIRLLLRRRLRDDVPGTPHGVERAVTRLLAEMDRSPVAVSTESANRQHYELPPAFFELVLGRHLKYSCCLWPDGIETLDAAEEAMLWVTSDRADLTDGQRVLELGCGWGSLTLWMAERYPGSEITAVSNSPHQRRFIAARAAERGLENVRVLTADMNVFEADGRFDRIVSVEMFEHMRNWRALLTRVRGWIEPDGRLFIHVFCHRTTPYFFEDAGEDDWMARHFFTGGVMPSADLLARATDDFAVEEQWDVDGVHYAKTARAWLAKLDERAPEALSVFRDVYGSGAADLWFRRWRLFFMACEELFGYRGGSEWRVTHARLRRSARLL